jgi:NADPH-dependent 2,4-dienoyl-CoA reductase/sulfur reductase-like enzyme
MSDSYRYLIVGAGTAGHFAAEEIRRHDVHGSIAIIGDEPHRPYHRPPLSKGVLTGKVNPLATYLRKDNFYEDNEIDVFTGVIAIALDPGAKKVTMSDGRMVGYEKLLLATGGKARGLELPGDDLPGVHTLRTLDDATAILEAGRTAKHALIIGAGFISAEVATSLWSMGVRCSIIMRGEHLLQRVLPRELSERLHDEAKGFGVELISGDAPVRFEGENGRLARAITREGRAIDCDLAVAGIGLELNVGFAAAAGIDLAGDGGILTDGFMRTSLPGIWAAGDIASYDDRSFARRLRIERTESAKGQGQVAGADMAGVAVEPYNKIPLYTFHIFDLSIKVFGVFETGDLLRIGKLDDRSCAYYAFRDGVLEGYLGYNRPYAETKMVKQQIQERSSKDDIIASLREFENAPIATVNG